MAMDLTPIEFADQFMRPYTISGNEIVPTLCPICHGGKNRDKKTFALNMENQTFNCKRGSCGAQGHFVELCSDFGVQARGGGQSRVISPPSRPYVKPKIEPQPIQAQAISYLNLRGISQKTLEDYRIGTDDKGNILFPFFDDKEEHMFNKFRYPRKLAKGERKAWREAGTKPILFGMHICDKSKPLCIFEGEIDSMAGHEAEIPNCVSVPSGAEDFTWLDTCWDFINGFKAVYLFGDNDEAGKQMIKKLCAKLSHLKVFVVNHPYKDANELLFRDGKEAVKNAYINAEEITPAGLIKMADVKPLDMSKAPKVTTSIGRLNQALGGFYLGDVTVVTGKSGEGKSTLLSQILLDCVDGGHKVCAYSGELRADQFQYWSDLQAAGRCNVSEYFDTVSNRKVMYVKKETRKKIHRWYGNNYWLYDNNITIENEELDVLRVFETAAKRYDCKVFAIDNLMTVDFGKVNERDFYRSQSKFVGKVVNFARLHEAHVFLIAHPKKTDGGLTKDDIGGSGDIHNRVDNVLALQRIQTGIGDSKLTILKNRWEGVLEEIGLNYDEYSRRLYTDSDGENSQYGWEFMDWAQVENGGEMPW